jgi:hypothetical protein
MDFHFVVDEIDNANQTISILAFMSVELKFIATMEHHAVTPSSLTLEVVHDVFIVQPSIPLNSASVVLQPTPELGRFEIRTLPTPSSLPLSTTNALVQGIKASILGRLDRGVGKRKNLNDVLLLVGCDNDPITQLDNP